MKLIHFFEAHPIFRYEEFTAFMVARGIKRPQSWKQQLGYHTKAGHLIHIRKFLYAVKPMITQDHWIDAYLLASKVTTDAIIAYHTALELHGVAYSTFTELTFLTTQRVHPFSYESQRFRAISQPKTLINDAQTQYGIEEIKRNGIMIKVTGLERTIVDILDRTDLGGGWEEIWRSLDQITLIDTSKMVDYALLLKNSTTIAKVGYFLEQRPSYFPADSIQIDRLLPHIPKRPHYMNRSRREKGKYIEKWRLIVPLELIKRTWEEPDAENI